MSRVALPIAVCAALLSCNATLGCTAGPAGTPETLSQTPGGNFTLYVSNQSFAVDPVDIRVTIDGRMAVDDTFRVGNQHGWRQYTFLLPSGAHTLKATSRKGKTELETAFTAGDKNWAVIDYWYYPKTRGGAGPTPRTFSFHISDKPIGFM